MTSNGRVLNNYTDKISKYMPMTIIEEHWNFSALSSQEDMLERARWNSITTHKWDAFHKRSR